MYKEIKKTVIVGGGTAGLISALLLKTKFVDIQIDVIYSKNIGTIGVGEGSTEHFREFIEFVGINQYDLLVNCDATYKIGILFDNWSKNQYMHTVQFPYNKKIGQYSYVYAKQISEGKLSSDVSSEIYWKNHINKWFLNRPEEFPANQFHFNTYKLTDFLMSYAKKIGINFIDDEITEIILKETGEIASLKSLKANYEYDFFIDCTGFQRLLINKLGGKWKSFEKFLKMKSAITFQTSDDENYNTYTVARAMDAGWLFRIPVWGRYGNGYIFDSDLITADDAKQEVDKLFQSNVNVGKSFKFDPGCLENVWIKNCCAIGLSASFFEPLEATSIASTIQQSFLLMHRLTNYNDAVVERYNRSVSDINENIRDFIVLHYLTGRNDTKFWKEIKELEIPYSLKSRMDMWKHKLPIDEDFLDFSDYIMFKADSFTMVMHGLDLFNKESIKKEFDYLGTKINTEAEEILKKEKDFYISTSTVSHKEFIKIIRSLY